MKLFGWALILAGGGLVVVGIRQAVKGSQPDEPEDRVRFGLTGAEQDAVDHACDFHDLNDGA